MITLRKENIVRPAFVLQSEDGKLHTASTIWFKGKIQASLKINLVILIISIPISLGGFNMFEVGAILEKWYPQPCHLVGICSY
jgi:hypothetical protein